MRKYNNPRLLNTVVAGPGMKHPTKPHVIVGDNGEFIQGDLMDANAVGELVDQKIDDSEEHIIPKIDELSEQLEQEITDREAADEDLSETIDSRIQDVVGAAPEALDTLKELADALNDDANFAATVTNELTELDERVGNNTSGISSLNTRVESLETSTSDWNENDPTSPSYIKNRTHYEETSERTIYTGNKAPIWRDNSGIFFDIPLDSLMQSGEEIEMKITPRGAGGSTVLKGTADNNGSVRLRTSYYPSGPSAALYNEYEHAAMTFNLFISGINIPQDANFEIKALNTTVHVLNEKFIPATIARAADVDLGVLKTGGVTYNPSTNNNQLGYGGTSGGGYINKINLNSGYITGLTGIYSLFDAPITISGASLVNIKGVSVMDGPNISGVNKLTFHTGGSIDGVGRIVMASPGILNMHSGTLESVDNINFANGATLKHGNGAVATGTDAIWANNFGVSGDLLFSGSSTVQKRFGSGALPVITFNQTIDSSREYTDIMLLGKGKALSIVDYYSENSPLQPSRTPEVRVSGTLNVSGGVTLKSGGVLTFGDGTTMSTAPTGSTGVPPILSGVRQIVGENRVQISMTGSTTGDGIDFGSAPLKNVNGIIMYSGGKITGADIYGNENNTMSGYSNIVIAPSGTLNMQSGQINNVNLINVSQLKGKYNDVFIAMSGNGRFNMVDGILETSGVIGGTISGTLEGTIQSTTFNSGNTFTTGFVDELKTALGLS